MSFSSSASFPLFLPPCLSQSPLLSISDQLTLSHLSLSPPLPFSLSFFSAGLLPVTADSCFSSAVSTPSAAALVWANRSFSRVNIHSWPPAERKRMDATQVVESTRATRRKLWPELHNRWGCFHAAAASPSHLMPGDVWMWMKATAQQPKTIFSYSILVRSASGQSGNMDYFLCPYRTVC